MVINPGLQQIFETSCKSCPKNSFLTFIFVTTHTVLLSSNQLKLRLSTSLPFYLWKIFEFFKANKCNMVK